MVCVTHWAICKCFAVMTESVKLGILGVGLAKVVLKPIAEFLSIYLYPLVGNKSESSNLSFVLLQRELESSFGGSKIKTPPSPARALRHHFMVQFIK